MPRMYSASGDVTVESSPKKTQRTGSGHINFKTHFIFSIFAVNECKTGHIRTKRTEKNAIFDGFPKQISLKTTGFFSKSDSKS